MSCNPSTNDADWQVESIRLVVVQVLLKDYKMDPLTSIAMYSAVSPIQPNATPNLTLTESARSASSSSVSSCRSWRALRRGSIS